MKNRPRFLPLKRRFKAVPPARWTFLPGEPAQKFEAVLVLDATFDGCSVDATKWNSVVPQNVQITTEFIPTSSICGRDIEALKNELFSRLKSVGINPVITMEKGECFRNSYKITARCVKPEKMGGWVERPIGKKLADALKS